MAAFAPPNTAVLILADERFRDSLFGNLQYGRYALHLCDIIPNCRDAAKGRISDLPAHFRCGIIPNMDNRENNDDWLLVWWAVNDGDSTNKLHSRDKGDVIVYIVVAIICVVALVIAMAA